MQEGIRTISQAIEGMVKPVRVVTPQTTVLPPKWETPSIAPAKEAGEVIEVEAQEETEQSPPKARAPRKYKAPKVISLELGKGTVPLKQFIEQKQPGDTDSKRFLVCAVWLKENLSINEVSIDHIHTCYRHMNWQTPKHPQITLDNLKRKNQWIDKGSTPGTYAINHVGENQVMEMGAATK